MGTLQKIGKSLMVPIAVLPAAALLLRFGELIQSSVTNPGLIHTIGFVMMKGGSAIFDNLPIIFAIGVAIGFAADAGVAGLAATIGYLVMTKTIEAVHPPLRPGDPSPINMGVLGGLTVGLVAASLYQRYHKIRLPRALGFFGGRRFVPIITSFSCLGIGLLASWLWPYAQTGIGAFGNTLIKSGPIGVFFYGVANRLLIPLGLHHVLNTMVWFDFGTFTDAAGKVVHGDLHRFAAGDPTAGTFMAGYYPIMMFALPAVCLAMLHEAKTSQRKIAAGILIGSALTSMVTGITEPIEFSFMFLAPILYGVHAILTGTSMALCQLLGIRHGFGFSAGLIDYVLFWGKATKPVLLLPIGAVYGIVYYVLFRAIIRKMDLRTPGMEEDEPMESL
jgi:PTS system N-acetylglucosamine-specific IIC component